MDLVVSLVLGIVAGILAVTVVYRSVPTNPMALIGALVIAFLGAVGILLLLKKVVPSNA